MFMGLALEGLILVKHQDIFSLINSLWPSEAIWPHKTWSTLVQVLACCLTAPSHYLIQCWLPSLRSSEEVHMPSFTKISLKIIFLNLIQISCGQLITEKVLSLICRGPVLECLTDWCLNKQGLKVECGDFHKSTTFSWMTVSIFCFEFHITMTSQCAGSRLKSPAY